MVNSFGSVPSDGSSSYVTSKATSFLLNFNYLIGSFFSSFAVYILVTLNLELVILSP